MTPVTKDVDSPLRIELTDEQALELFKLLTLLNNCPDTLVEKLIERMEKGAGLGIALLYSLIHTLPHAFERLWEKGGAALKHQTYETSTYLWISTGQIVRIKNKPISLINAAIIAVTLNQSTTDKLNESLKLFAILIRKLAPSLTTVELRDLISSLNDEYGKFSVQLRTHLYNLALQEDVIHAIANSDNFLLGCVINSDKPNIALLKRLLSYPSIKAIINKTYSDSTSSAFNALHAAIVNKTPCPEVVETLIQHGSDVNAIDGHGKTPLHIAAETGQVITSDPFNVVKGVAVDPLVAQKTDALPIAESYNKIIDILIKHGADASRGDRHGISPFGYAVTSIYPYAMRKMIAERREYKALYKSSDFGLIVNALIQYFTRKCDQAEFFEVLRILLEIGCTRMLRHRAIEQRLSKPTPSTLKLACYYWLAGAANADDEYILAIRNGDKAKLETLLLSADKPDAEWLFEALVNAIVFEQTDIATLLLESGADGLGHFQSYNLLQLINIKDEASEALAIRLIKLGVLNEYVVFPRNLFPELNKGQLNRLKTAYSAQRTSASTPATKEAPLPATPPLAEALPSVEASTASATSKVPSLVSGLKSPETDTQHIDALAADLSQELAYIRKHINSKEFIEGKDALASFQQMLSKFQPYADRNRTCHNQYHRFLNQYTSLCARIKKLVTEHEEKTPTPLKPVMGGAGIAATVTFVPDSEPTVSKAIADMPDITESIDVVTTQTLLQQTAQQDFIERIRSLLDDKPATELTYQGIHYNLIRLFELWSLKSDNAYIFRQHLVHRHFDIVPSKLFDLAQELLTTLETSQNLDHVIVSLAYFKMHIAKTAKRGFFDQRSSDELIKDAYHLLSVLAQMHERLRTSAESDATVASSHKAKHSDDLRHYLSTHPIFADAVRMTIVKLGEALRDRDNTFNQTREALLNALKNAQIDGDDFCDEICHARNVACHTHNIKMGETPGKLVTQERLSVQFLFRIMRIASTIPAHLTQKAPADACLFSASASTITTTSLSLSS